MEPKLTPREEALSVASEAGEREREPGSQLRSFPLKFQASSPGSRVLKSLSEQVPTPLSIFLKPLTGLLCVFKGIVRVSSAFFTCKEPSDNFMNETICLGARQDC